MNGQIKISELVSNIENAFNAGAFPNYIQYVRFPFYKNLKKTAKIKFTFPITILTGPNGSGKSSVLHAIYGCPGGYSPGQFWFTTALDPIRENRKIGEIPSIIYAYKLNDEIVEVIKRRSGEAKGLDYWEPSRPIAMYGMKIIPDGGRNPTIAKRVEYLDFRSELSAFDKYFYFGNFHQRKTLKSKQDVIRRNAKHVKAALISNSAVAVRSRASKAPILLSDQKVRDISQILGKPYNNCTIVEHNFYETQGSTIYFNTDFLDYSEAFAGRGEYAVVKLVHQIYEAPPGALIVLDEPEVSLHPGAQEQLKLFLLKKCLEKKLQIVISSHAPKIVEWLPDKAIKLFYQEKDGKFDIKNNCSYFEAFESIGIEIDDGNKKTIILEDTTAKEIVDAIINELKGDFRLLLITKYYPGGAPNIYKRAVSYSEEGEINKFILLDGDQLKVKHDPSHFTLEQSNDVDFLSEKLQEETDIQFSNLGFKIDGNAQRGGNNDQKKAAIIKYLTYLNTNLEYLPLNIPEEIIWNARHADALLATIGEAMPTGITDFKTKFAEFAKLQFGSDEAGNIAAARKMFIQDFIRREDENYHEIVRVLTKFKDGN